MPSREELQLLGLLAVMGRLALNEVRERKGSRGEGGQVSGKELIGGEEGNGRRRGAGGGCLGCWQLWVD